MAVGVIFEGPGVTQAQYDQVRNELNPDNTLLPGLLYHAAGPTETGWCIIEVWESPQAVNRFFWEKLEEALQHAGIVGALVEPRSFWVANIMQP